MKKLLSCGFILGLVACTTMNLQEDQVLSRSDHLKEAPAWANLANDTYPCDYSSKEKAYVPKTSNAKNICMLGLYEQPEKSSTNINMIIVAAEAQAKRNFAAAVKSKISSGFNQASQDYSVSSDEAAYTLSLLNEASVSGMLKAGTYWERVAVTNEDGVKIVRRVYTLSVLSREKFEEALSKKSLREVTKQINKRTMSYVFASEDKDENKESVE